MSFESKAFDNMRAYYEGLGYIHSSKARFEVGSTDGIKIVDNPWEWRRFQKWMPMSLNSPKHAPLLQRVYLRAPMTEVRAVFEHVVAPVARIKRVLGINFDEVEAVIRNGPRDHHRFIGSAVGRRLFGGSFWDLHFDVDVRQAQIL